MINKVNKQNAINYKRTPSIIFLLLILSIFLICPSYQSKCLNNNDCREYYNCIDNKCVHKNFFPLTFFQVIEIILMVLFSAVATATGIGGGAIYSTLFMVIENFDASKAFPISNFMILFSSLSVYLLGAKMSIDVPEHKFVDYDLVLIFCPMMLLGTKVGVILNAILPNIYLTVLLILTLIDSTRKINKKYKNQKEKEEKESQDVVANKNKFSNDNTNNNKINTSKKKLSNSALISKYNFKKAADTIDKLKEINLIKVNLFEEDQPIRWHKIRIIIELLGLLIIDQLIEGSSKIESIFNLKRCSLYWILTFIGFSSICLIITFSIINNMHNENKLSNLLSAVLVNKEKDVKTEGFSISSCSQSQLSTVVFYAFLSGIVAGMLGVGGGVIITPLFFELGINPKIATSTSNFLLVFSSCSSTIQYLLSSQLTMDYGIILGLLCMISSLIGYKFINNYVQSTGKSSYLLFCLLCVMILSLILLPIAGISKIIYQINQNQNIFGFKNYCR